jgi:FixJ family two-component response regulator
MERVLIVDDEPNVLQGLRRQLRNEFDLELAVGGAEGIQAAKDLGPFAVVVSDMRMPGIGGVELLKWVKAHYPDTVRMVLTGHADLESAVQAVNEGHIFRFLTKPCSSEQMIDAVNAGVRQYQLLVSERDLLERTLRESIRVLSEVLSLVHPEAFSRTHRVAAFVGKVVRSMGLDDPWEFEVAALLSQLGCISVPSETVLKAYSGESLSGPEKTLFDRHPAVAAELLTRIPRLESVAAMIKGQRQDPADSPACDPTTPQGRRLFGARLLRIALGLDVLLSSGMDFNRALSELAQVRRYDPKLLESLRPFKMEVGGTVLRNLAVREIRPGMILDQNLHARNGVLLATKGWEITPALIQRLRGFAETSGLDEPIRVLCRVESQETVSSEWMAPR